MIGGVESWWFREVPAELRRQYIHDGFWTDESLGSFLSDLCLANSSAPFEVCSTVRPFVGTVGGVFDGSKRIASWLVQHGAGPATPVACQLPNWAEAVMVLQASALVGAPFVPITHFYGPHERAQILGDVRPSFLFAFSDRIDHKMEELARLLDSIEFVVAVGSQGLLPSGLFDADDVLANSDVLETIARVDPDLPAIVGFTSGTERRSKGVLHTSRTVAAEIRQLAAVQPDEPATLVGAPISHAIGLLSGVLLPLALGRPLYLIDQWNPAVVLEQMIRLNATAGSGAPYFFKSLVDADDFDSRHGALLRYVGFGGASVDQETVDLVEKLGISMIRMYGSTEHPSVSGCMHADPIEFRHESDGAPLEGVEVSVRDADGLSVGSGTPGEIYTRGPDLCAGFTEPRPESFTPDGWYRTGDVGVLSDRHLRVLGRESGFINRGGFKINPLEIETMIASAPGVRAAAVVGVPDPLWGERLGVAIVPSAGVPRPTLRSVRGALKELGVAPQKWPELIVIVDQLPVNQSGKPDVLRTRSLLVEQQPQTDGSVAS